MDEAIVGRVRDLSDQAKRHRRPPEIAKTDRRAARIAAEEESFASARAGRRAAGELVARPPSTKRRSTKIDSTVEELHDEVADDPGAARRASSPATAPPRFPPGRRPRQRQRPDLAGERPSSPASGCAGGGCTRASTSPSRRGRRSAPRSPARDRARGRPTGGYGNYTCINHGGGLSDLLRPPVRDSRSPRAASPGRRDRLRRLHRALLRRPPPLRGPDLRRADDPMGYL